MVMNLTRDLQSLQELEFYMPVLSPCGRLNKRLNYIAQFGYRQSCQKVSLISTDTHLQRFLNWVSAKQGVAHVEISSRDIYSLTFIELKWYNRVIWWSLNNYSSYDTITEMQSRAGWRSLDQRRSVRSVLYKLCMVLLKYYYPHTWSKSHQGHFMASPTPSHYDTMTSFNFI